MVSPSYFASLFMTLHSEFYTNCRNCPWTSVMTPIINYLCLSSVAVTKHSSQAHIYTEEVHFVDNSTGWEVQEHNTGACSASGEGLPARAHTWEASWWQQSSRPTKWLQSLLPQQCQSWGTVNPLIQGVIHSRRHSLHGPAPVSPNEGSASARTLLVLQTVVPTQYIFLSFFPHVYLQFHFLKQNRGF